MNDRIQELARQAGLKVESWMTNPPKPFQILGSTEQFEKFAELIVQECIGIVENYPSWYGDYRDQIENAFRGHLLAKMKYHFGIVT